MSRGMRRIGTTLSCVSALDSNSCRRGDGRGLLMLILDAPERYLDAPISLQLIGRRYEDEKVLDAFEMIAKAAELPLAV